MVRAFVLLDSVNTISMSFLGAARLDKTSTLNAMKTSRRRKTRLKVYLFLCRTSAVYMLLSLKFWLEIGTAYIYVKRQAFSLTEKDACPLFMRHPTLFRREIGRVSYTSGKCF